MRISQVKSLTTDEKHFLLYLLNYLEPINGIKFSITSKELPWIKDSALLFKLNKIEKDLTDEGKIIHKSLMEKINKHPIQEAEEYERRLQLEMSQIPVQLEFELSCLEKSKFIQGEFNL